MNRETQAFTLRLILILLGAVIFTGSMIALVWFNITFGIGQEVSKNVNDAIVLGTMFGMIWGAILTALGIAYHKFF